MGLFNIFKKKDSNQSKTFNTIKNKIAHETVQDELPLEKRGVINLRKESINKICLTKQSLNDLTARVVFAIDYSGSMGEMYRSGKVQKLVERCFPLALRFDDDGAMGVWKFDTNYIKLPDMKLDNINSYVNKYIYKGYMGGTRYSEVINDICKQYVKKEPANIPTYVIFVTDGDCSDKKESEKAIKEAAKHNIFWQFIGIGNDNFSFLKQLDNMEERFLDNANFFECNDISKIDDEELYKRLLSEFDTWVIKARNLKLIK